MQIQHFHYNPFISINTTNYKCSQIRSDNWYHLTYNTTNTTNKSSLSSDQLMCNVTSTMVGFLKMKLPTTRFDSAKSRNYPKILSITHSGNESVRMTTFPASVFHTMGCFSFSLATFTVFGSCSVLCARCFLIYDMVESWKSV